VKPNTSKYQDERRQTKLSQQIAIFPPLHPIILHLICLATKQMNRFIKSVSSHKWISC